MTKPYHRSELIARVYAVLRCGQTLLKDELTVQIDERLLLDRAHCEVVVDGRSVALSPKAYKVLGWLVANRGRVLTHQSPLTQIWAWEYADQREYLKIYVCNLRKKICRNPGKPGHILTNRGLGYRFQASPVG
jgi:two-component system KDP operon response regulator KdpE